MNTIPVWKASHQFVAVPVEGGRLKKPLDLVTYDLLVADFLSTDGVDERRLQRWAFYIGLEWIGSLADQLRRDRSNCPLSAFLGETYRLRPGYGANTVLRESFPAVPKEILAGFVTEEGSRIDSLCDELRTWARELLIAGRRGERPVPAPHTADEEGSIEYISARLDELKSPRSLLQLIRPNGKSAGWAFGFTNLLDRLWFELFELFVERPRLGICKDCGRLYVPVGRRAYCRRHLWDGGTWRRKYGCVTGGPDQRSHRREQARRAQAYKRAVERLGADHPVVIEQKRKLDEWRRENRRTPGPPPRAEAALRPRAPST